MMNLYFILLYFFSPEVTQISFCFDFKQATQILNQSPAYIYHLFHVSTLQLGQT